MTREELEQELAIEVDLVAAGRPNRPGTPLTPQFITVHNTSNANAGADAHAHARFIKRTGYYDVRKNDGTTKRNYVSWHFTVDDKAVVKHLPVNEVAWHAGTNGNRTSLGIEICMHQGIDQQLAFDRAAKLVALLMHDLGLPADRLRTHKDWTGKNCPVLLLAPEPMQKFRATIAATLAELSAPFVASRGPEIAPLPPAAPPSALAPAPAPPQAQPIAPGAPPVSQSAPPTAPNGGSPA